MLTIKPIDAEAAKRLTNDGKALQVKTYLFEKHRQVALNAHAAGADPRGSQLLSAHAKAGGPPVGVQLSHTLTGRRGAKTLAISILATSDAKVGKALIAHANASAGAQRVEAPINVQDEAMLQFWRDGLGFNIEGEQAVLDVEPSGAAASRTPNRTPSKAKPAQAKVAAKVLSPTSTKRAAAAAQPSAWVAASPVKSKGERTARPAASPSRATSTGSSPPASPARPRGSPQAQASASPPASPKAQSTAQPKAGSRAGFKRCGTPGCTLARFHLGPCTGAEVVVAKRAARSRSPHRLGQEDNWGARGLGRTWTSTGGGGTAARTQLFKLPETRMIGWFAVGLCLAMALAWMQRA